MYTLYNALCELEHSGHDSVIIIPAEITRAATLDRLEQIGAEFDCTFSDIKLEGRIAGLNRFLEPLDVILLVHHAGIILAKSGVISEMVVTRPPESFKTVLYIRTEPTMCKMNLSLIQAIIKYPGIGRNIIESIFAYFEYGRPTGDFLKAVLANNLSESFGRADMYNRACLFDISCLLYNFAPHGEDFGRGSFEAVDAWIQKAILFRAAKEKAGDTETSDTE